MPRLSKAVKKSDGAALKKDLISNSIPLESKLNKTIVSKSKAQQKNRKLMNKIKG